MITNNIYCPTCGTKICETSKSQDLKVRCKKCKSDITIDKDETKLKIHIKDTKDITQVITA